MTIGPGSDSDPSQPLQGSTDSENYSTRTSQIPISIEQTIAKRKDALMPEDLKRKLVESNLMSTFAKLIPSRQKEILRYLYYLKTPEAKARNIEKLLSLLGRWE